MILFPPAKINLGLNVLGKREDGYHEVETCMYSIPLFDVIEILRADEFKFIQTGLTIDGNSSDNLCVQAFRLLEEAYQIPSVEIRLLKNIPMGAGLGGGSADATFVLRGLNELFDLNLSNDQLREFASKLGSDCPFFVEDQAQIAKGRGELLEPIELSLKGKFLKIINPGIHIGTAEAYSNVQFISKDISANDIVSKPLVKWKDELQNSFEKSVFQTHPLIEKIKKELYIDGAEYASMSGSGSTVFGIYNEKPELSGAYDFERVLEL